MPDILKRTVTRILKNYGHNILLQRRIHVAGAGVYSIPTDGSYYSKSLERWTVRSTFAGRKTSLTDIQEERPEGVVHTVKIVIYFPAESRPREGDRVYEPDERFPGDTSLFVIDYANPVRGFRGEIVYYEIGATRQSPT